MEKVRDEEYLEMLRLQQFEEDDEMVQHLNPGFDIEKIFGSVKLPCESVKRINNQLGSLEL